jgi:NTE family protein
VLPPVHWGERLLVDGGLVSNTPIARAIALDAAVHAFMLLVDARLKSDLARYAGVAELILLPPINPANVQPTDFDQADRLMRAALHAARDALDDAALRQAA